MLRAWASSAVVMFSLLSFACKKEEPKKEATQEPAAAMAPAAAEAPAVSSASAAKKYFKERCVVCHGTTGAGDGPGAAALDPKPRAFADASWQDEISDDELAKVITDGGVAVGKSTAMPAHPDLKAKPEVLKELVAMIRGFRKD